MTTPTKEQAMELVERLKAQCVCPYITCSACEASSALTALSDALEASRKNEAREGCDIGDEDPGNCIYCGKLFERVRPGKSQPACDCYEVAIDQARKDKT